MLAAWKQLFIGAGPVAPLDRGNTANAPAEPPIQAGSYEYIQSYLFPNQSLLSLPVIPPAFRDWNQFPLNQFGADGLTGGGVYGGKATEIPSPPVLYYDETSGTYVDLTMG